MYDKHQPRCNTCWAVQAVPHLLLACACRLHPSLTSFENVGGQANCFGCQHDWTRRIAYANPNPSKQHTLNARPLRALKTVGICRSLSSGSPASCLYGLQTGHSSPHRKRSSTNPLNLGIGVGRFWHATRKDYPRLPRIRNPTSCLFPMGS